LARFGSQTHNLRQLASRIGTGIGDSVVCDYRRGLLKGAVLVALVDAGAGNNRAMD